MKRKTITALTLAIFIAAPTIYKARAEKMHEVTVDIGKNIVKTAKDSGAPRYGIENHWGYHIYELVNLRPDVVVRFVRPGLEIEAHPLFALTMYADSDNHNDLAVEKIDLQYAYKAKNHQDARIFIDEILKQFQRAKWKRYIRSSCPAISGRSAYLDEHGKINGLCPLDPAYSPDMNDWTTLMDMGTSYEWLADGILARLTIDFDVDTQGLTYNMALEFLDYAIDERKMDAMQARELVQGDQKGWKSTENYKKALERDKVKIEKLEHNAQRRGDHLVARN